MAPRNAGHVVVDALVAHGVEYCFGVAGESYLAVLDGLHERRDVIRYVPCRNEGGAAMMADAYAKLTGRPGVCLVTRGPGACNASPGIHVAHQDSTPVVVLVGQVGSDAAEREAFQEIDYRQAFGPLTKWVAQADRADRIPELLHRAFATATSGRPGPVVLALPEDVLSSTVEVTDLGRYATVRPHPAQTEVERVRDLIAAAERPLAIVGGGDWSAEAAASARTLFERWQVPVAASFRCQDYVDNRSPAYAGDLGVAPDPALAAHVRDADLILAVGARLGESTTMGYTLIEAPEPLQRLIHVYPAAEELGRVYRPMLGIAAGSGEFLTAALAIDPPARSGDWCGHVRASYDASREPLAQPGAVNLGEAIRSLREVLPDDTVVTNGAGNYTVWAHRYWQFRTYRSQLAPTSGSMGYGVPAAVAAKIADPARTVLAFAGDGCFQMNGQEFATAVQEDAAICVIVIDNGMLGTIRMHQERTYPARVTGTSLRNPDFAALARAYGGHGERVEATAEFVPAVQRALAAGVPSLVHVLVDPQALTIRQRLDDARAAAPAL